MPRRQTAQDVAEVPPSSSARRSPSRPLLAGGNPQIAKHYGDASVQAATAAALFAVGSKLDRYR